MANELESKISRLQHRLEVLRSRDLTTMGYESKTRHELRIRKLEAAVREAKRRLENQGSIPSMPSESPVADTIPSP